MANPIAFDGITANWPNGWRGPSSPDNQSTLTQTVSSLFSKPSHYFHALAAYQVLPSLKFKKQPDKLREMDLIRSHAIRTSQGQIERASFLSADNVKIDGVIIWNQKKDAKNHRYTKKNWMLYFNGNAESYEDNLKMLAWYAKETRCNVMAFNYRGVGYSEGFPDHGYELSLDGDAAFQFLLRQGVSSAHILIHARSLGGAVGTQVRAMHPNGPICNERSFDNWKHVVSSFYGKIDTFLIGLYLKAMEWEFQPTKDWDEIKGMKWIIVSSTDEIIDYKTASFYKKILKKTGLSSNIDVIKLPKFYSEIRNGEPEGHNMPLKSIALRDVWQEHKKRIKTAFNDRRTS